MMLAILFSLKSVESLENRLTPLFLMRTESQALSSSDADAWCKWALTRRRAHHTHTHTHTYTGPTFLVFLPDVMQRGFVRGVWRQRNWRHVECLARPASAVLLGEQRPVDQLLLLLPPRRRRCDKRFLWQNKKARVMATCLSNGQQTRSTLKNLYYRSPYHNMNKSKSIWFLLTEAFIDSTVYKIKRYMLLHWMPEWKWAVWSQKFGLGRKWCDIRA